MRMEENCGAGIHLPPTDYIHTDIEGKHVIYTTLRQTAKHTVGLDRCCHNGRLYTRHGKKYFRLYRNFFAGKNRDATISMLRLLMNKPISRERDAPFWSGSMEILSRVW